jgi:hypothetical protein
LSLANGFGASGPATSPPVKDLRVATLLHWDWE